MINRVEFTGLKAQSARVRAEVDSNIARILDHGQFIMGPEVRLLEERLSEYCGARNSIAVANGTDALQIALMAHGVGNGDLVFVPSFTYTATAEVILVLGATPVFVDVDPATFNMDVIDLRAKIAQVANSGLRPAAIIAVDLFGLPADYAVLNAEADRFGLHLIADSAQSFGAETSDGRKVGTLAPVTTTSFFPAKPLGCYGDGGAMFVDDDALATKIRSIRVHGQGSAKYETVNVGMNSRLDTLQAGVLLAKLAIFAEEVVARNALADRYESELGGKILTPCRPQGTLSAWAQYTIRVDNRDAVQAALAKAGVPTAIYYPVPMHLQPAYVAYGEGVGSLPLSELLSAQVLSLPMSPYWTEQDVEIVCSAVLATVIH